MRALYAVALLWLAVQAAGCKVEVGEWHGEMDGEPASRISVKVQAGDRSGTVLFYRAGEKRLAGEQPR